MDSPSKVAVYNHWDTLNYIYGVVKIGHELIGQLKAVLEFEPGLYTHHQVSVTLKQGPSHQKLLPHKYCHDLGNCHPLNNKLCYYIVACSIVR